MKNAIRCSACPMMKISGRAERTANSRHLARPRGYCNCTHPEAWDAFRTVCPESTRMEGFIAFTKGGSDEPDIKTAPKWCPRRLMETPREISKKAAYRVIDTRKPLGLFFLKEGIGYTGIDNRTGEAWTEEFTAKDDCLSWLKGSEPHEEQ